MVVLGPALPSFNFDSTLAFYTSDDLLDGAPFVLFYGPSATTTSAASASRIQTHILSPAGLVSFPRLAISPSSPLYAAVHQLPRQEQGDDVCRGLAFSLYKYFTGLPDDVRAGWESQAPQWVAAAHVPDLFGPAHAALLAAKMQRVADVSAIVKAAKATFADQSLSWVDVDVVFPPGSLRTESGDTADAEASEDSTEVIALRRYGEYAPLVRLFGEPAFLPTSKLRRAPSKPGLSRNRSFLRPQKESLRREMCELLDTEESYVSKLYELVHSVANDFRQNARSRSAGSSSPGLDNLEDLFPPSLDAILDANSAFLAELRDIVHETENAAIEDIERTESEETDSQISADLDGRRPDVTGAVSVAKCLLRWLPKFDECYGAYITAHANFSTCLRTLMRDSTGSFSRRVVDTGEQRLMSLLIEPVQRLPRYSMFVANMIKQLPLRHPAMSLFLTARDGITDICARESAPVSISQLVDVLGHYTTGLPADFPAQGRFITAVDVRMTMSFRRAGESGTLASSPAVLIVFTDVVVLLKRNAIGGITASGLRARFDNPIADPGSTAPGTMPLEYINACPLDAVDFAELDGGHKVQFLRRLDMKPSAALGFMTSADVVTFHLTAQYDGRASRLVEELAKARVEWRFSELERESSAWEVRAVTVPDLSLFSALCESGNAEFEDNRTGSARIQVLVDHHRHRLGFSDPNAVPRPETVGADVLVLVTVHDADRFSLHVRSAGSDDATTDQLRTGEVMPVLVKRLSNALKLRSQLPSCPRSMVSPLLLRNKDFLAALPMPIANDDDKADGTATFRSGMSRPTSPVKKLTNLFSASVSRESSRKSRHHLSRSVIISPAEVPKLAPLPRSATVSKPTTPKLGELPKVDEATKMGPPPSKNGSTSRLEPAEAPEDPISRLELTLTAYVIALHARKGNVVGRTVQNRSNANELDVNEVYNGLLDDPSNHQTAAQCSVDVLLAGFDKFIQFAWTDAVGPIVTAEAGALIQAAFERAGTAAEFIARFRDIFFRLLSPPNQRAFRAVIALLADLLDGTNNDSDRGILTACFADILLVPSGVSGYGFISIIDRFIDDFDAFFAANRPLPMAHSMSKRSKTGSHSGSASVSGAGLSANTSIRKRLGLGLGSLSRDSHRSDPSSLQPPDPSSNALGSVWRSLSKNKSMYGLDSSTFGKSVGPMRPDASGSTSSVRSTGSGSGSGSTPTMLAPSLSSGPTRNHHPHERPSVLGAFAFEHQPSPPGRPLTEIDSVMGSIHDSTAGPRRRTKRRSSASDIRSLRTEWDSGPRDRTADLAGPSPNLARQSVVTFSRPSDSPVSPVRPSAIPLPKTGSPRRVQPRNENVPPPRSVAGNAPFPRLPFPPSNGVKPHRMSTVSGVSPTSTTSTSTSNQTKDGTIFGRVRRNSASAMAALSTSLADRRSGPSTPDIGSGAADSIDADSDDRSSASDYVRPGIGRTPVLAPSGSTSASPHVGPPRRLRVQSPTKLRERLQTEHQAVLDAETSLHTDLDQISAAVAAAGSSGSAAVDAKVAALEARIRAVTGPMQQALAALSRDFDSSLHVSEARARNLDKLYHDAVAEVEAMQARFDDERDRILARFGDGEGGENVGRGGDGPLVVRLQEETRRRQDLGHDVDRLRRENARLKRELAGLRAQLGP